VSRERRVWVRRSRNGSIAASTRTRGRDRACAAPRRGPSFAGAAAVDIAAARSPDRVVSLTATDVPLVLESRHPVGDNLTPFNRYGVQTSLFWSARRHSYRADVPDDNVCAAATQSVLGGSIETVVAVSPGTYETEPACQVTERESAKALVVRFVGLLGTARGTGLRTAEPARDERSGS